MSETDKSIYYGDYRVVLNIFKTAYFHIFGELFIDEKIHELHPADCQSTLGTGFEIFYEISWAGWLNDLIRWLKLLCMHSKTASKDRRDQSKHTCDDKNLVEVILLGLYMLFIVLIFVNILIAIFRTVWFLFHFYIVQPRPPRTKRPAESPSLEPWFSHRWDHFLKEKVKSSIRWLPDRY